MAREALLDEVECQLPALPELVREQRWCAPSLDEAPIDWERQLCATVLRGDPNFMRAPYHVHRVVHDVDLPSNRLIKAALRMVELDGRPAMASRARALLARADFARVGALRVEDTTTSTTTAAGAQAGPRAVGLARHVLDED